MKIRTARSQLSCGLCGLPIPKGHRYWLMELGDNADYPHEHRNCAEYYGRITAGAPEEVEYVPDA